MANRTVMLTLAAGSAVVATDTNIKVSYTKPSLNPIKDLAGNEADALSDEDVGNQLADSTPPALHSTTRPTLAADGRTLTVTFNEPMMTSSTPAATAFTVKATPQAASELTDLATNATVEVVGSTVTLTLAYPIAHNDTNVKISYAKPGSGSALEDVAGNDLADFTELAVMNSSDRPRVKVEALDTDASTIVADPAWRFTRPRVTGSRFDLVIRIDQDDTY